MRFIMLHVKPPCVRCTMSCARRSYDEDIERCWEVLAPLPYLRGTAETKEGGYTGKNGALCMSHLQQMPGFGIESFQGGVMLETTARQDMRDMLGDFRALLQDVMESLFVEPITFNVFQRHHGSRARITRHQRYLTEKVSRLQ